MSAFPGVNVPAAVVIIGNHCLQSVTPQPAIVSETAGRLELACGGVGGVHRELRHDEDGVLLALVELLAELMGDHGPLGGGVVPMEVHHRRDSGIARDPVVVRDEHEHGRIAVAAAARGKRRVLQLERRGHAACVGDQVHDARADVNGRGRRQSAGKRR